MYSLQTLHINMSYAFSDAQIDGTLLKELDDAILVEKFCFR
jgi:hypothetical protein